MTVELRTSLFRVKREGFNHLLSESLDIRQCILVRIRCFFIPIQALIMVWSKAKKYSIEDSCFAIATDYEKKIANRRRVINVRDRHGK
jgi:hypothetical protein